MTDSTKPERDPIEAMFRFAVDYEQTADEARKELEDDGVDVDTFLAKLESRVKEQQKAARLAWQTAARKRIEARKSVSRPKQDYSSFNRPELMKMLHERQAAGQQIGFHKFEALDDDDLRTLLQDLDEDVGDEEP